MQLIRKGQAGQTVKDVQMLVNFALAPHKTLRVDGIFGPKTHAGVVQYQTEAKLSPDGIVGPKTIGALMATLATRGRQGFERFTPCE